MLDQIFSPFKTPLDPHGTTHALVRTLVLDQRAITLHQRVSQVAALALIPLTIGVDLAVLQISHAIRTVVHLLQGRWLVRADWKNHVVESCRLTYLFFTFIPYAVLFRNNKKWLEPLLHTDPQAVEVQPILKELGECRLQIETLQPYRAKLDQLSIELLTLIDKKARFLAPEYSLEEETSQHQDGHLIRLLNRYIFFTHEQNYQLFLIQPLTNSQQQSCHELNCYFKTVMQLLRRFDYLFSQEDILFVNTIFRGEFYQIEAIIGCGSKDPLEKKIFFTFVKLFSCYTQMPLEMTGLSSTATLEKNKRQELYSYLIFQTALLFDLYLEKTYLSQLDRLKLIHLDERSIRKYFRFEGDVKAFVSLYLIFSTWLQKKGYVHVNKANRMMMRSFERVMRIEQEALLSARSSEG